MKREGLFHYSQSRWGITPDYPFHDYPDAAVLRHAESGKWFAIIMPVNPKKLGISTQTRGVEMDIINLKCQPPLVTMLLDRDGVFPAYHMNRKHWVSIALDGQFPENELFELLELSFRLTSCGKKWAVRRKEK